MISGCQLREVVQSDLRLTTYPKITLVEWLDELIF
jgi:hypothetical protein